MTTLTHDDMQTWHVHYQDGRLQPQTVTAAYPASSDDLPGWVIFKDWRHKTVAMVRADPAAIIRRDPADLVDDPAMLREAIRALMRDRIGEGGTTDFYAYLEDAKRAGGPVQPDERIAIDHEGDEQFGGPRLYIRLTGYKPPRRFPADASV